MDARQKWIDGVVAMVILMMLATTGCGSGSSDREGLTQATSGLEATFTVSTDEGSTPLQVVFDASGSTDSGGAIVLYAWRFGDGDTGSGAQVSHQYTTAGTYTARLTVTDDNGQTDSTFHNINVTAPSSLSGTVTSTALVVTDSDVNDSNSTPVSNDAFDEAQSLTAPCSVSGYVNMAQTGAYGHSYESGDTDDYFKVSLTSGMTITLYMAESADQADLSLYLYDESQNQIDASLTVNSAWDSLTVASDGTFYVRVEATTNASTYVLTLGTSTSGAGTALSPLRLSANFVPGEVLVRFETSAPAATVSSLAAGTTGAVSTMGFVTLAGAGGRDRRLKRSETTNKTAFFNRLGIQAAVAHSLSPGKSDDTTRTKMETLWMIRGLRQQDGVLYAEPNYYRQGLSVTPNDTYYDYQWHYPLIRLPEAWEITTGSSDVVVAVIDTGVLLDHPDLEGQLVDGYDFISDKSISRDGDGVDNDPDDPGDDDTGNSSFHGTHVAGTIAAATGNKQGVAGIGWNVRVMPLRVLGKGGGTTSDILEAVKYAAGLETDAGVQLDSPVDVMNLSLGGEGYSQIEAAVFEEAREQGVIIVASAGNNADTTVIYPAGYDDVISVSAVTIDETLADYSSYGSTIAVAAPGGSETDENGDGYPDEILSTIGDDSSGAIEMTYAFCMGTSMAAPHVAGVIALMKSVYAGLTPDQFDALLAGGYLTQDIGDSGWDKKYGYGLIDAYQAVAKARELASGSEVSTLLAVTPGTLEFGTTETLSQVVVKNAGSGALTLTGYASDADWLTVTPSDDVDADTGLGTYTVAVSRDGLSSGTYSGTLTFTSGDDQATVAVSMEVSATTDATDGGYHYILLLDADTMATVAQVGSAGQDGVYTFEFSDLSYGGTYYLYAGTDPDNDGYICGEGESCGAYPSLDDPAQLTITGDQSGLQFSTDLVINTTDATATRTGSGIGLPILRQTD